MSEFSLWMLGLYVCGAIGAHWAVKYVRKHTLFGANAIRPIDTFAIPLIWFTAIVALVLILLMARLEEIPNEEV